MNTSRALSLKQACARLSIGLTSLRALLPQLRAYKVGGSWRIDSADLEAFVEARKPKPAPMTEAQAVSKAFDPNEGLPDVPEDCRL